MTQGGNPRSYIERCKQGGSEPHKWLRILVKPADVCTADTTYRVVGEKVTAPELLGLGVFVMQQ